MADPEACLSLWKEQRDHIQSVISSDPGNADASLLELLESLNELISLEEQNETSPIEVLQNGAEITGNESSEYLCDDVTGSEPTLSVSHADLSALEADLHASLLHLQCRVPLQHSWGQLRHCNAMVQSVESTPVSHAVEEVHVRVLFLQPTHRRMLSCEYFLGGKCRFTAEQCHFSHGEVYALSQLLPYQAPEFSSLTVGSRCLCVNDEGIWEHGTVAGMSSPSSEADTTPEVTVRLAGQTAVKTVKIDQIVPDSNNTDNMDDDPGEDDAVPEDEDAGKVASDEDEFRPHAAWDLPVAQVSHGFAGWETHTKGVGSKLMAKMGFVTGQGLGVRPGGRTEPVPAHVLPKGRSLDYCMALKEGTKLPAVGDNRRNGRKPKRRIHVDISASNNPSMPGKKSVFDFLNGKLRNPNKLHRTPANPSSPAPTASTSAPSVSKDPCKALNIEALKLHDKISGLERDLDRLRKSLNRNTSVDRAAAKAISQRIKTTEQELSGLRSQQDSLQKSKDTQKEKKALTIF
ncbi:Zinc finger CCCH-type with G patch domain-containing protein [Hypsibius exemplaris]|uniref:Zinc finger CCCH-type with G patch domain-containing protein n=1 Tax=Hypsibius exemplaris TaxID=2072580 RepID=A0A1W0WEJ3_HYPEX|nr:Zinc finger CCCH-type with G patch domain-containing protein [Hypsibius exemplaris]